MPASADVNVTATILKTKDITVTEKITINKTIDIFVASIITPDAAAEAQALMNVTNDGHTVNGPVDSVNHPDVPATFDNQGDETNFKLSLSALMSGSGNTNTGVWGFNQDVGNMTNQGNVVSVAGITDLPSFADAQAEADQSDTNNSVTDLEHAHVTVLDTQGNPVEVSADNVSQFTSGQYIANKSATIQDSINTNTGVFNVNQNAGNMNNQTNGVAAAVGEGAQVAMSEAALGQENSGNKVFEIETVKRDLITGSVNGNTGIVNVNQSVGNMNNQGNVVSLAATTSGAILSGD
jgi:hypothetical protein